MTPKYREPDKESGMAQPLGSEEQSVCIQGLVTGVWALRGAVLASICPRVGGLAHDENRQSVRNYSGLAV